MNIGYVGLGKMGMGMVQLLIEKGHEVIATDPNEEARKEAENYGARTVGSATELVQSMEGERFIWIMVPHQFVDAVIEEVAPLLNPNDVVVDGGNSFYKDSGRRGLMLETREIQFMGVGVSGGPSGARNGACMMIGGDKRVYDKYEQLFKDLCVEDGYGYMGGYGAGHYVKMVHNGIEYGMMQSIAEGFALMHQSEFDIDLKEVTKVYNHGSVIESSLIGWLQSAYEQEGQDLENISGEVSHSGEGEWTVNEAREQMTQVPAIETSFQFRVDSKGNPSYIGKVVSALRNQFGGHKVHKSEQ